MGSRDLTGAWCGPHLRPLTKMKEAGQEVQCEPVTRQLCSALPSLVTSQAEQVCEVSLEGVCTTILATKYVKSCEVSPYGVRECAQYPVQKPVKKCAEVPQQTCIRSRLKHKCRRVTQNVCRQHCHVQSNSFPSRK